MNFSQVRQVEGQLEKGYQIKLAMFGTPRNIKDVEFSKKGTKSRQMDITDDAGETQEVKIWGDELNETHENQRLSFDIAPNPFKNKMYYNGFWNAQAVIKDAPRQPRQGAQQPAGKQNVPKGVEWGNKDRLIVAQVVYKALANLSVGGSGGIAETPTQFDIWLMGNQNALKRHVDLIMDVGAGKSSEKMAQEFEEQINQEPSDQPPF